MKKSVEFAVRNLPTEVSKGEEAIAPPSLTQQTSDKEISEAVLQETTKGYDIVFLGVEHAFGGAGVNPGHFNVAIEKIVEGYEGATAIALASGDRESAPKTGSMNILVPTTGADYSHHAVEIAIALARVSGGKVTALYVTPPAVQGSMSRLITVMSRYQRSRRPIGTEQPLVENVKALGRRYGVFVITEMIEGHTVEDAVVSQAKRYHHDLIVLGAKARPGEGLFFGQKMAAILEKTPGSCLVISS